MRIKLYKALFICVSLLLLVGCAVATPFGSRKENTTYVIRQDYDLGGEVFKIPKDCILKFKGGSFRNGTLIGNNTFVSLKQTKPAFENVLLEGSFNAKRFPINAYISNTLDYFYSFIQAFSGTDLYLSDDYSVTEFLGVFDGTTPSELTIDGNGHKLTLYSFGAYKVKHCSIKDITIDSRNNIAPRNKWKSDNFNFGIVGDENVSTLELSNVTFTKECEFAYFRSFSKLDITECIEDGSYFFVYDCENVSFQNNSIMNSSYGYYSIGKQSESGQVQIRDNRFRDIKRGGIILSGGLKHNVSVINNILENVGCGGASDACINIHPRGTITVSNNNIVANVGAVTLDIDAASQKYYSDETEVAVENNEISNVAGDTSIHGMALVGLGKLYFCNNKIKDQLFYFWDTPYMEFTNNTVSFSKGFDRNTTIGKMSTHETTDNKQYNHIYKNNVFNIPYAKSYVKIEYLSKAPVQIEGEGNTYSTQVDFVDQYKKFSVKGDIKLYK